jgi:hypothetical protein
VGEGGRAYLGEEYHVGERELRCLDGEIAEGDGGKGERRKRKKERRKKEELGRTVMCPEGRQPRWCPAVL